MRVESDETLSLPHVFIRSDYACSPALSTYDPRYEEIARYPSDEEIEDSYKYARKLGLRFEAVTFEKKVRPLNFPTLNP